MKIKQYLFSSLLLMSMTACTKDENQPDGMLPPNGLYPLEVIAQVAGETTTRAVAGKDAWKGGETIGVKITSGSVQPSIGTYIVTDASGAMTSEAPFYWQNKNSINVSAWYPAAVQNEMDISDQSTSDKFALCDILTASVSEVAFGQAARLNFEHRMAKVRVTLTSTLDLSLATVEVKSNTLAKVEDGVLIGTTNGYIKACREENSNAFEAWVVPGEAVSSGFIRVTIGGNTYTYSPAATTLETKKTYTYAITVKHELPTLTLTEVLNLPNSKVTKNCIIDGQSTEVINRKFTIDNTATNVTLKNIKMSLSDNGDFIRCEGNLTLTLEGTNVFTKSEDGAVRDNSAIQVTNGTLTINGNGSLSATIGSSYASGIRLESGTNLIIDGGTITLDIGGGYNSREGYYPPFSYCAAIGSYFGRSCGNITINGGSITASVKTNSATGDKGGAGIGAGGKGSCGDITINGGTVIAQGGYSAAGIGSSGGGSCGNITLSDGTITATKAGNAIYDVGPGYNGNCGAVTVTLGVQVKNSSGGDARIYGN